MIKKMIVIIAGSFLIAIGINYFVIPHQLLDGGIIGLGLIGKYAFGLQPGLMIILLSIPLYVIAFLCNRKFFYNGIHGLLLSSFFIDIMHPLVSFEGTPLLISSLIGGILIGTGMGLMLLTETSTDGIELFALMLSKLTAINVGVLIFMIDGIVLWFGWVVIPDIAMIYSILLIFMIGLTTSIITSVWDRRRKGS
ncbi:YitT family protein [Virgibacillus sp. NKC19-3]|uniref:YitT family protein n=1 Tax=Virgibacillus saliphilus TaxID=2831674 RepID=UPI001C9AFFA5|nr:YitT family protein [Virgibacillus sp. NKC19-3]MBY7144025.1 YitT family protein [Virgibacillus sp. NKC19-3]